MGKPQLALSRPRVAVVAPSLEILGGQGVQARILMDALIGDGWHVDFVPVNPRFAQPFAWLRGVRYARTLLNQALYAINLPALRHADVVHVYSASYWSFLLAVVPALIAARLLGKRTVLNYHSGEAADHLANWGMLVHPFLRLADTIVVPSSYLQTVFARFGYEAVVIKNVLDLDRFRYRERSAVRPRLLSNRNLEKHYGVHNTLQAFAQLQKRLPEASLTVAGYGSEEQSLKKLAASLGLGRVRFVGRVPPEEMPALYDEADIFLNSSTVDNQPVSILEAFASGLPVVSTPTGDIPTMMRHGESGLLVPANDPEAMATAVHHLLDNPARALLMARNARRLVDGYRWALVRSAWNDVYVGRTG